MSTLRFGERARKVTNFSRVNETEQQTSLLEMKKMLLLAKSEITNLRMENLLLRRTSLLTFVGGRESTPTSEKIERTSSIDSFDTVSRKNEKNVEDEMLRNEIIQLRNQNEELLNKNIYMEYKYKNNKNNKNGDSLDSITIIKSHNGSEYSSDNGENCSENGKISENSEVLIGDVYRRKSSKFFEYHFADELAGIAVTEKERRGSENFRRISLSMSKKEIMKDIQENKEFNNNGEYINIDKNSEKSSKNINNLGESDNRVPRNVPQNVLEICPRNRNVYSNERNRSKRESKNHTSINNGVSTSNVPRNEYDDKCNKNNNDNNNNNNNSNNYNNNNNNNNDDEFQNIENSNIDEETKEIKNNCEEDDKVNEVVIKVVDKFAEDYEALQLILSIEEKLVIIDDYMKFNGNGDHKKEKVAEKRNENEVGKRSVRSPSNKTDVLEKGVKENEKVEVKVAVEKVTEREVEKEGVMDVFFSAFRSPFFTQSVAENLESEMSSIVSPLPLSPSVSSVFSLSDIPTSEPSTPLTPATSTSFPTTLSNQIKDGNDSKCCHSGNGSMTSISDNNLENNNTQLEKDKNENENQSENTNENIENGKEKNLERVPRNLQLNRNLKSKRGLKKNSKKDSLQDSQKLKTEIDGIFGDTRLNVLSGFFDIVSSVFAPVKANDIIVTADSTQCTEIDNNNNHNNNSKSNNNNNNNNSSNNTDDEIINDGNSAEIVKNLENTESNTCLPVGYYDSDLKQFCRVLPKYEISVKKLKKKEDDSIDFTRI